MGLFRLLGADGAPVEVDETQAREGIARGELRSAIPLRVRAADGRLFEADPDRLPELLAGGDFELDTEEAADRRRLEREYGGMGGEVAAGALGVARGATLGLSDVAGAALGGGEAIQGYQDVNPNASIGGEVAGTLGSLLIPGAGAARGGSLLARGARAVSAPARGLAALAEGGGALATRTLAAGEAGLGRRLFARGVGGAVEGSIEGAVSEGGRILSEEALGQDPDTTAEAVLARLGTGALYGGTAGGLLGSGFGAAGESLSAAGRGASALADRVGLMQRSWSSRFGNDLHPDVAGALAHAGEQAAQPGRLDLRVDLSADDGPNVLRQMMDGSPSGRRVLELVSNGRARDENVRALRGAVDELMRTGQHVEDYARGSLRRADVRRQATSANFAEQAAYAADTLASAEALAVRLQSDPIFDRVGQARGRDLAEYLGRVRGEVETAIERGGDDAAADLFIHLDSLKRRLGQAQRSVGHHDPNAVEALRAAYDGMIGPLERADLWGDGLADMQREINKGWTNYLSRASQWDALFSADGARDVGIDPWRILREADPAKLDDFLNSAGTARNDRRAEIFESVLAARAEFNETIARHMTVPADLAEAARAAPAAVERARAILRTAVEDSTILNQWREATAQLGSSRGISGAISGALYAGASGAVMGAFGPSQVVRTLSTVQRLARQTSESVSASVRRFLGSASGAAGSAKGAAARVQRAAIPTTVQGITSAFNERSERLDEQSSNSIERLARSTAEIANGAPQVQQALQVAAARGQQYLAAQRPTVSLQPGDIFRRRNEAPARDAMERWLRVARVVDDPMSALRSLEARDLTMDEVDALRTVYPALYREIVAVAMQEIAEGDHDPAYQDRLQLGLLLGVATDPSLTPESLATIQAAHVALTAPTQQSPAPTQQAPDIAGGLASGTQQLEARRMM